MLELVADDATYASDGGGRAKAALRIVRGGLNVVRLMIGWEGKGKGIVRHRIAWLNGEPAIVTFLGDQLVFTTSLETDGERIVAFYRVLNPEKLRNATPK
jgi:RNA polymerase sigma-70 factor (ECF subfamily)